MGFGTSKKFLTQYVRSDECDQIRRICIFFSLCFHNIVSKEYTSHQALDLEMTPVRRRVSAGILLKRWMDDLAVLHPFSTVFQSYRTTEDL